MALAMSAKKNTQHYISLKSESAGKGKKFCPSCHKVIAARSSTCPLCSFVIPPKEAKEPSAAPKAPKTAKGTTIDEKAFIRVLAGKGFKFVRLVNELTGEVVKEETDQKISKLDLQFAAIPKNAENIHVIQTTPQIQVAMTLDKFLELAGIKP